MADIVQALRTPAVEYYHQLWGQPEYSGWIDEQMSWKKTCYVGDWSFLADLWLRGPDALKLVSELSVNDFSRFEIGQAKHIIQCNEAGKVIAEGILMRLGEEEFRCQSIPAHWIAYKLGTDHYNATARYDRTFNFQVSGPNSLYAIERASGESLRRIKFMHFAEACVKGHKVTVLRQGMAGEVGYEVQGPEEHASDVYDAILECGREFGIRRMGGRVAMVNHVEACFPTVGFDYLPAIFEPDLRGYREYLRTAYSSFGKGLALRISGSFEANQISAWYRSPVELGWTKNINFGHAFVGREALEAEVADPKRAIATLVWDSDDVVDVYRSLFCEGESFQYMEIPRDNSGGMDANIILRDGEPVGVTTSRCYSYYFRRMLSLCTIDVKHNSPGTSVTVVWGDPGKQRTQIRATVAPAPYKKDNRRIDVTSLPAYRS